MNKFESPHQDEAIDDLSKSSEFSLKQWKTIDATKRKGAIDTVLGKENLSTTNEERHPNKIIENDSDAWGDQNAGKITKQQSQNADKAIINALTKVGLPTYNQQTEEDISKRFGASAFSSFSEDLLA